MPYIKYNDKEIKSILKSITVLCDSREQKNEHITTYLDSKEVINQTATLNSGDYSALLPAMPDFGIVRPLHFDSEIAIERKGSLEELSGNLTQGRERLEDEFTRLNGRKIFLLIENPGGYAAIQNHQYKTQYNPKSYLASLLSFQERFGLNVVFCDKATSGSIIYGLLYYHVRNYLIRA